MKSMVKLATVAFAAVLCFASCALAQNNVNSKMSAGSPAIFTLTLGFDDHGGNTGCNQGGGGGGWWGDWGGWGDNNNSGCKSVPEGGTTLTYLSLAGLCCLGAVVFRSRRAACLPETNS